MYTYRLTGRGRIAVIVLVIVLFSLTGMGIMAGAYNNLQYKQPSAGEALETPSYAYSDSGLRNTEDTHASGDIDVKNSGVEGEYEFIDSREEPDAAYPNDDESEIHIPHIDVESAYIYDGKKYAFLTFDDGPSKNITPQVLDVLKRYNIEATFFVLGSLVERNSELVKETINSGHAIGIHTYSHNYKRIYESAESFLNEIEMTDAVLKQNLGESFHTRLFRFPGGSFESYKSRYKDILNASGYVSIDWNVVNGDGESSNMTPEKLLDRLKATSKGKKNLVVLMHDSSTKQSTADALPEIIEYLKSERYEFAVLK